MTKPKPQEKPGRYSVQVFTKNSYRSIGHQCDGTYDTVKAAFEAGQNAVAELGIATVIISDAHPGTTPAL